LWKRAKQFALFHNWLLAWPAGHLRHEKSFTARACYASHSPFVGKGDLNEPPLNLPLDILLCRLYCFGGDVTTQTTKRFTFHDFLQLHFECVNHTLTSNCCIGPFDMVNG
jgi:hypothetical protein